jgi:RND superfamily putative drug exporter
MGFGLAFAILIDATLVRLVLVPALMELMGKANWYLPSWLKWLPDLRVEAETAPVGMQQPVPEMVSQSAGGGGE